jgi:hypothetical protein
MPMFHQETDPMLFRLNWEGLRNLKRFYATHIEFIATWRTRVLSQLSGKDQRRFLRQTGGDRELIVSNRFLTHHRLQIAGAVANGQKMKLPAVSPASQPSSDGHLLPHVLSGGINRHDGHEGIPSTYAHRRLAA